MIELNQILINSFNNISILETNKSILLKYYSKIFQRKPNNIYYNEEFLFKITRCCLSKKDIKNNFIELKSFIFDNTKILDGIYHEESLAIKRKEHVVEIEKRIFYILKNELPGKKCNCGNIKWFKDFNYGYHSCKNGSSCIDVIEQKKNRMINKTGYSSNLNNPECKEQIKKTNIKKYGTPYPMMNNTIKTKSKNTCLIKYGCGNISRRNFSKEVLNVYSSKEKLLSELKFLSYKQFANKYKISIDSLRRTMEKYNIEYEKKFSNQEKEMSLFLEENQIKFLQNDRNKIYPLELDFFLPDYNLGIELNGLYWHSDKFKDNNYHLDKWKKCQENGIRLISINEDEWNNTSNLIKNKILNVCGRTEKGIYARKCFIKKIDNKTANNFLESHHIQGRNASIILSYGAYSPSFELIGVICYNKQRGTNNWELIRFCHNGKNNPGLFSKLFNFSINDFNPEFIVSFADLRYSDGNLYEKNNFKFDKILKPDYRYVKDNKTYHKSTFKKSNIKAKFNLTEEQINSKTEREWMKHFGYVRLYDVGKIRYIWKRK